jgi:hypothetical protein
VRSEKLRSAGGKIHGTEFFAAAVEHEQSILPHGESFGLIESLDD